MQENEHHHHDETRLIDTGHGKVELSIFEEGQLPHWRLRTLSGQRWASEDISLTTLRENSTISQTFEFVDHGDYLESTSPIPEPLVSTYVCLWDIVVMSMTMMWRSLNTTMTMTTLSLMGWM